MRVLYNIGIRSYFGITGIVSRFNPKAKLFYNGQKGLLEKIQQTIDHNAPIIWVHCSSVGEFEQARPIIEWYKSEKKEYKILLTFFSPSGYELRKNYDQADWVFYMPADTTSNAVKFINTVKPAKAIFIKYEFWYNYLHQLKLNNIETYIVSAIFRPTQHFFKWYGSFFRKMLKCYTKIFVQDEQSYKLLESIGVSENVMICGDTRFDRVYKITQNSREFPAIAEFAKDAFTIVAGSSWGPDEEIIAKVMKNFHRTKLVIAPHEIGKDRIANVMEIFKGFKIIKFSELDGQELTPETQKRLQEANVLIIDCIGILSSIYRYGKFAYIGGGFGVGIHNILEAATYGCPVVFGPNYKKFKEANDLISLGGATSINNSTEFYSLLQTYTNVAAVLKEKGDICGKYVQQNLGSTQKVVSQIEKRN